MSEVSSDQIVFFFGAGASAPFGIPTMKQFVTNFEKSLIKEGTQNERKLYTDIKENLEKRLGHQVDLEGVFSVIDGIIDYTPERLGLLSLYATAEFKKPFPTDIDKQVCKSLREKFQTFVKEKCEIPTESFDRITQVYRDFFNRFPLELDTSYNLSGDYAWNSDWTIFTTNYDICLEYYWRDVAGAGIDTGFDTDRVRKMDILKPEKLLMDERRMVQLFKLHGSVNWLIEKGSGRVIEVTERGRSLMGREYAGEMMIYPIAEKELYLDPYISMLLRLNRELERKPVWVVIGYSFNDPIVREIFLRKSNKRKHLILVHPQAKDVFNHRLSSMKAKSSLMKKWFGLSDEETSVGTGKTESYKKVNHQIIHLLKETPRFGWEDDPVP